jgi:hypothetical protein
MQIAANKMVSKAQLVATKGRAALSDGVGKRDIYPLWEIRLGDDEGHRRVIRATRMMDLLPLIRRKAIGVIMMMSTMVTTASGRLG